MRHVALELTLTDAESCELMRRIRKMHNTGPYETNDAMDMLQFKLRQAMEAQPENILFFRHDTDEVIEQRKLCDFCDGEGVVHRNMKWETCDECEGTGKDCM